MENKMNNMIIENRKCITVRRKKNTIYPGDIEGYDYVVCPECGLPNGSLRKHMRHKHNMTDNEINKKLKEYNIIYMTPQRHNFNSNIERYMERLKTFGLTIVDGRIKEISKEKECDCCNTSHIHQKEKENNVESNNKIDNLINRNIENINLINKSELKKLISDIIKDIFIGLSSSLEK